MGVYGADNKIVRRIEDEVPESVAGDIAYIGPSYLGDAFNGVNDFVAGGAGRFCPSEGGAVMRDVADLQVGGRIRRILRLQRRGEQEAKN